MRVSNSFDPDQNRLSVGPVLIWVQTVCEGYRQTTKVSVSNERVKPLESYSQFWPRDKSVDKKYF